MTAAIAINRISAIYGAFVCTNKAYYLRVPPVFWTVKITGDSAIVTIVDYEGPESAGSQDVTLRKINGKWFVVNRKLGRVS